MLTNSLDMAPLKKLKGKFSALHLFYTKDPFKTSLTHFLCGGEQRI